MRLVFIIWAVATQFFITISFVFFMLLKKRKESEEEKRTWKREREKRSGGREKEEICEKVKLLKLRVFHWKMGITSPLVFHSGASLPRCDAVNSLEP